jgi:hypothetical protein
MTTGFYCTDSPHIETVNHSVEERENIMAASIQDELIAACQQPGCPLCRLVQAGVYHYLQNLFYESVNDIGLRQQLRRSLGFCSQHARDSLQPGVGDALGVSIIYNDVFTNLLRRLPEAGRSTPSQANLFSRLRVNRSITASVQQLLDVLEPQAACPACNQQEELERVFCPALGAHLEDKALSQVFQAGDGLCLPHLRRVALDVKSESGWHILVGSTRARLESMQAQLAEFIRKNDYRFHGESIGAERDAWQRAVRKVVGEI